MRSIDDGFDANSNGHPDFPDPSSVSYGFENFLTQKSPGYTAANENATPDVEKPYIEKIQRQYYAALGNPPTPLSNADAQTYGMASTPTLALVDRAGIVRWYHPGAATEEEIAEHVEAVLK